MAKYFDPDAGQKTPLNTDPATAPLRPAKFQLEWFDDKDPVKGHFFPGNHMWIADRTPHLFDGFTTDMRWNGWACPYFTFEQAQAVIEQHNNLYELAFAEGEKELHAQCFYAKAYYDAERDAFCFAMEGGEWDVFGAFERDGTKYYCIGAWCWTWLQGDEFDDKTGD